MRGALQAAAAAAGFSDSNKLGSGGYGPVYKGLLDGLPVAVKCLDTSEGAMQGEVEFLQEAQILGRLHHPHIVLLIGVCPACCMLVYELLDNGNLEEHILGSRGDDLLWQDRVRITAEVASALLFLHSAPEPIIHLDLKPANILLSRNLTSKIGDVGLSRLAPSLVPGGGQSTVMDTRLVGTPSFMDPEYLRTGRFGPKSDIFSLGAPDTPARQGSLLAAAPQKRSWQPTTP
ncbi:U-box domain-containing protein 34 [Monoraphidium neglectum]|uniref:U-box domain-containing protein 34 n=1 Tax=Monoraphidium neglectum TaxID=145388 RepID=A0A0D2LMR2_9CHLO|nr:U-box domain-containing protein 34 [Monoraphidium neglectum]KIY93079.1 U-box domain-containing protein 34 [Monoraphidium neglectum]|eukprot:XP_013892099.1 U-box domain-containing protein 34 [Monoraphidium neglectum]